MKPTKIGLTVPIKMLDEKTEIRLVAYVRVSRNARKGHTSSSYRTQENIIGSCAHTHCAIPTGGFDCITETGGARYRVPAAMQQILNGHHNVVCVAWVSRFLSSMETWNVLHPLFEEKGIQIWSVVDGIGSLMHPDLFNAAIKLAEDEVTMHTSRMKQVVAPNPNPGTDPYSPYFNHTGLAIPGLAPQSH